MEVGRFILLFPFLFPNGQDNRRGIAESGLIAGLGRLAKPNTSPVERTTRKEEYHFRLPEWDVTARPNIERTQHKRMKAA